MLKYATYLLPYLIRAKQTVSIKSLVGVVFAYVLIGLGVIFIGCAGFIVLKDYSSTEIAFLVYGILMLLISGGLLVWIKRQKKTGQKKTDDDMSRDPISAFLPQIIKDNETVKNLVSQVSDNPITATTAAVTLGILLSQQFFED